MPELGEVAHAASLLRKYLLGKTIRRVVANPDEIVLVKPLTPTALEQALVDQPVTAVGRHGKYFWLEVAHRRTLLLHFGMTGWIHVHNVATHFIPMESGGDKKQMAKIRELEAGGRDPAIEVKHETPIWPPRFTKFILETEKSEGDDTAEIAFTDARRLARVRLFEVPADQILELEPLRKLGKDWSQHETSVDVFKTAVLRRRVPVKALLLDQTVFSGIGNWMADEILYHSRLHPEQYANTLQNDQIEALYQSVVDVCRVAAETEGNTAQFPRNWLMLYRWGKARSGKEQTQKTAEGHVVSYITVGGRTSCYVPDLQKLPANAKIVQSGAGAKRSSSKRNSASKSRKKQKKVQDSGSDSQSDVDIKLSDSDSG